MHRREVRCAVRIIRVMLFVPDFLSKPFIVTSGAHGGIRFGAKEPKFQRAMGLKKFEIHRFH